VTKNKQKRIFLKKLIIFSISFSAFLFGLFFIALGTIKIPDFRSFEERRVESSTKIYDKTGEIVLYDVHQDVKRTMIPFSDMGANIKNVTVAIEDSEFYKHYGIRLKSIVRGLFSTIFLNKTQGGSTITQQLVKNTLLTSKKTLTRKFKEWVLAIKMEQVMSKEEILGLYLNEVPYGGNMYGIYEASKAFFGKEPRDLTLAESAYLAGVPQAPTYYSPYGKNKDKLEQRKNTVLDRTKELGFISEEEYKKAKAEKVVFLPEEKYGIKAPHFVLYIKEYLEKKYGVDAVERGGLKVTTTIDYNLQKKAEEIVLRHAKENETKFKGKNAALVAIDPKTGQILSMVGSRDYFDKEIDGNFNVTLSHRQPGSSFKPFIYATAFEKGYTPETVVFDLPTEFQTTCDAYGNPGAGHKKDECYMPKNYDNAFRGPITLKNALAQSINVPAIKMLYLVGINDSIKTARDMGINSLTDGSRYGLTLVIGGGEVTPLEMTSAYGVFATNGVRHQHQSILKVEDFNRNILEEFNDKPQQVLSKNTTLQISDIMSDETARIPTFGKKSSLYIDGRDAAVKTGTTNDNKDAWIIGYTPSLVVGVWAGNNDNTSMLKGGAAIAGPIWHEFMVEALKDTPIESFEPPQKNPDFNNLKPTLQGYWQGGESFWLDKISGGLATDMTPKETKIEKVITNVHSILYWVDKSDPLGPSPANPANDPQFNHWEIPVQNWWAGNSYKYPVVSVYSKPGFYDNTHTEANRPVVKIDLPKDEDTVNKNQNVIISVSATGPYSLKKVDFFLNNTLIGVADEYPFSFSFIPSQTDPISTRNEIRVVGYDSAYNNNEAKITLNVNP